MAENFHQEELSDADRRFYEAWADELNAESVRQHYERMAELYPSAPHLTVGQLIEALRVYHPDLPLAIQAGMIYRRYDGITISDHPSMGGAYLVIQAGNRT